MMRPGDTGALRRGRGGLSLSLAESDGAGVTKSASSSASSQHDKPMIIEAVEEVLTDDSDEVGLLARSYALDFSLHHISDDPCIASNLLPIHSTLNTSH